MSQPCQTPNAERFFDLHTTGSGFLSRVRVVKPTGKKGTPYLACSISGIRKLPGGDTKYTNFDVIVRGSLAATIVQNLHEAVDAKRQVVIGFRIGDTFPEAFTYQSGNRAGQTGVAVKGRLLKVLFAKVDGQQMDLRKLADGADVEPVPENELATLETRALAYLNRVRFLSASDPQSVRVAAHLAALYGRVDDVQYSYIDSVTDNVDYAAMLEDLKPALEADGKILMSVSLENIYPETFVYQKGDNKGQTGVSLKAQLTRISSVKVDGQSIDLDGYALHSRNGTNG